VDPAGLKIPAVKAPNKREHDMAKTLVAQMTEKWDPTRYTDDYSSALMKLIEEKIEHGGKSPAAPRVKPKAGSNVIDLVAMLEQSLNQAGKSAGAAKKEKSKSAQKRRKAA
jgi:DNA end-binding protein Ku